MRSVERDTHQAHVLIGNRGYGEGHPYRTALFLLNNIIGGPGMNSLLNVSLRENHGLVYTVESTTFSYTDAGVWSIYFGCDENDIGKCLRIVRNKLKELCLNPLSPTRLKAAKKQLTGQMLIAADNFESYALALGKTFAHTGKHRDINLFIEKIQNTTADDLLHVANDLFLEDQLTTLIYK